MKGFNGGSNILYLFSGFVSQILSKFSFKNVDLTGSKFKSSGKIGHKLQCLFTCI